MTMMFQKATGVLLALLVVILQQPRADGEDAVGTAAMMKVASLKEKLQQDLLGLREQVEDSFQLYKKNWEECDDKTLEKCLGSNYDACQSAFPDPVCVEDGYGDNVCAGLYGSSCRGNVYDFTHSSVIPTTTAKNRLSSGSNNNAASDDDAAAIVESVCFSQTLDDYFVGKMYFDNKGNYWKDEWNMDSSPVSMNFGDAFHFREFPARPSENCAVDDVNHDSVDSDDYGGYYDNDYDDDSSSSSSTITTTNNNFLASVPTPAWYQVATNGGPKNIIIILDTSYSMSTGTRLSYLKKAAIRVIDELTPQDRIAVISFSDTAEALNVSSTSSSSLAPATRKTKRSLQHQIWSLKADGATKFLPAFEKAFQVLNHALDQYQDEGDDGSMAAVNCNTALLFISDGKTPLAAAGGPSEGYTEDDVIQHIQNGVQVIEARTGFPIFLFSYQIAFHQLEQHYTFMKDLACSDAINGHFVRLTAMDDPESIAKYSKIMTVATSGQSASTTTTSTSTTDDDNDEEFVPYYWSEYTTTSPFPATAFKMIAVSTPVFDKSLDPPILLGAVALTVPLRTLERALGIPLGRNQTIYNTILEPEQVLSSSSWCPSLQHNPMQWRKQVLCSAGGQDSMEDNFEAEEGDLESDDLDEHTNNNDAYSHDMPSPLPPTRGLRGGRGKGERTAGGDVHKKCPSFLPSDTWLELLENVDMHGLPYSTRACCERAGASASFDEGCMMSSESDESTSDDVNEDDHKDDAPSPPPTPAATPTGHAPPTSVPIATPTPRPTGSTSSGPAITLETEPPALPTGSPIGSHPTTQSADESPSWSYSFESVDTDTSADSPTTAPPPTNASSPTVDPEVAGSPTRAPIPGPPTSVVPSSDTPSPTAIGTRYDNVTEERPVLIAVFWGAFIVVFGLLYARRKRKEVNPNEDAADEGEEGGEDSTSQVNNDDDHGKLEDVDLDDGEADAAPTTNAPTANDNDLQEDLA